MNDYSDKYRRSRRNKVIFLLLFLAAGLAVNLVFSRLAISLDLPLYLDNIGTILAAVLGGYVPGAAVGYLTNLINGLQEAETLFYGCISIIIGILATWFYQKRWFNKWHTTFLAICCFALVGGGAGSILTWLLYGQSFGTGKGAVLAHFFYDAGVHHKFIAQLLADLAIDFLDKAIVTIAVLVILRLLPEGFKNWPDFDLWYQRPLTKEEKQKVKKSKSSTMSLRYKVMIVFSIAMIIMAVATTWISFILFRDQFITAEENMADGVTRVVERILDPNRVDEYLLRGEDAVDYAAVKTGIENLLSSSPDISYIYVYQIREDGCHVVFDADTPDLPGEPPGKVIEFEEGFQDVVPALLNGEQIEPIISNDSYGWLLTLYKPMFDSEGNCKCYIGVDISMERLRENEIVFITKVIALLAAFFALLLVIGLWLVEYTLIMPINSMAVTTNHFAYNSENSRIDSLENLESLDIRTGDEVENLYQAFTKTSLDIMHFIEDVEEKNEMISRMQNNLIMVMADMVESRDEFTGNHIKNTAEYCKIIMEQLKKEGIYTEDLTDEFIENVTLSAPLHDIGKIKVPDAILNKPGRLTPEEFDIMKRHSWDGKEIIAHAADTVQESSYLNEAQNLAAYHHEKWNGTGYPTGLSGESIPLSARIMAVADVFDALVSKRSYKDGFPVEKAFDIIREGIGTHFDPYVAAAFLHAEERVLEILETKKHSSPNQ